MVVVGIACYLFAIAIIKDIKRVLKVIDENSKTKKMRKHIFNQMIEFIDLHSAVEQLSCVDACVWNL